MDNICVYLPNSELGVDDDIVCHGKLGLVLWRVEGLNLSNNAALGDEHVTMFLRNIR